MDEADFFTEQDDGQDDGKDDAELVDRRDLGDGAVLEREEVEEPRGRAGDTAQGDEEQALLVLQHLCHVREVTLHEDDTDQEHCHDDGAHGCRDVAVDALQADLAEDGDECRADGGGFWPATVWDWRASMTAQTSHVF